MPSACPAITALNPVTSHLAALCEEVLSASAARAVAIGMPAMGPRGVVMAHLAVRAEDPGLAARLHATLRTFTGPQEDFQNPSLPLTRAYTPVDVRSPLALAPNLEAPVRELQWLVFDEGSHRLLGWVLVLEPSVARLRRLAQSRAATREGLQAAHRRDAGAPGGHLVLDENGAVIAHSESLTVWLTAPGTRHALGAAVRAPAEAGQAVAGSSLTLEPLVGATRRWLVQVHGAHPITRSPASFLTPAQRAVADYAAAGATCAEIAKTMETSVETVRTHLREVYRRLEVACRAELAQLWLPTTAEYSAHRNPS